MSGGQNRTLTFFVPLYYPTGDMNVIHYHTLSGGWSAPFLPPMSLMCRDLEHLENWPTIWQLKECQIGSHQNKGGKKMKL